MAVENKWKLKTQKRDKNTSSSYLRDPLLYLYSLAEEQK